MRSMLGLIVLAALTVWVGCSSAENTTPDREAETAGSAGSSGSAPGGKADDGTAGIAGAAGQGADEPGVALPPGCAPTGMLFVCNPITNEGCDTAANESCEYGLDDYFTCYPPPNDVQEGGDCNWEQGPFCAPSLTCDFEDPEDPSGVCRRHCCSDEDCEAPERCESFASEFGTLGACH